MSLFQWRDYLRVTIFAAVVGFFSACSGKEQGKLLVITNAANPQVQLLELISKTAAGEKIETDTTGDFSYLTEDSLQHYSSVIFLGLHPDTLQYAGQIDLQRFVESGGGMMLVNDHKDTVRNWAWFSKINDERKSNDGDVSKRQVDNGRVYFASILPGADAGKIVHDGVTYILQNGVPDYTEAKTERVPESNRFVVEVLDTYMYEPMEMVVFNDGRILYVERRGDIKLYDPKVKKTKVIATFDVSITGNYEDGILGVTLDPDFEKNHWIYINYSPAGNVAKQNVSRFEMRGDSIIRSTEKIIIEIPTQRETCCHSGGHLTFGPGKNLYISTGDNTSSKESDGFSPIDERPGRAPFDAQKSSGNTHDLRGKILRIHPEPDGSYTIPDGNLFPNDGSQGKPEIFVMGTRNAFRFSVDPKTGFVYWGDVGPDGGVTNERGPQSYDEFNQAKKPGNYGWPYFVADNKAYADFDFATNKIGPRFNPERPENLSPNNTGSRILPPAQKPMIWYPYGVSEEFPSLGTGSRSAMAGPLYYYDDFKDAKSRFPEYFNRKLFIYEWARSWVKVLSFDEDWNLESIQPFLPGQDWYKPIDMKFGPDGSLYVLQYGANYFEHNPDSRLVKITYVEGNREPVAKLTADKTVGASPITIRLSANGSFDADKNDVLKYSWQFPGSDAHEINGSEATVTYSKPGTYRPIVKVTDRDGKTSSADVQVRVGNEMPDVEIGIENANRSFYFDNAKMNYTVQVKDKEDGVVGSGIEEKDVFVSFDYLPEGKDLALLESNAQLAGNIRYLGGRNLLEKSDCKTCHNISESSIGPSYSAVADRYKGKDVVMTLADKIIRGGNGNWGKNMMAAHPQHSKEEAAEMARYILAVNEQSKGLPVKGTVAFNEHRKNGSVGFYVMRASYTDKGNTGAAQLTNSGLLILRNPKVEAEEMTLDTKMNSHHEDGSDVTFVYGINNNSFLVLDDIDLTGIGSIQVNATAPGAGSIMEVHTGSANGPLLGHVTIWKNKDDKKPVFHLLTTTITPTDGRHNLYFVFKNSGQAENVAAVDWIKFARK